MFQVTSCTKGVSKRLRHSGVLPANTPGHTIRATKTFLGNNGYITAAFGTKYRTLLSHSPKILLTFTAAAVCCSSLFCLSSSSIFWRPFLPAVNANTLDVVHQQGNNASDFREADKNKFTHFYVLPPSLFQPDTLFPRLVKSLIPPGFFDRGQLGSGGGGKQLLLHKLLYFNTTSRTLRIPLKAMIDNFYDWLDNTPPGRFSIATANLLNNVTKIGLNITGVFDVYVDNIRVRLQRCRCPSAREEVNDRLFSLQGGWSSA